MDSPEKTATIRRLQIDDAEEISRIYGAITQKPVEADFKRLVKANAQKSEDACFVAEIKGNVVAFMISNILTLGFGIEKSAWISTLGVDPDYMGQGIGASLAESVIEFYRSKGITNLYTTVRWDSTDLLSFFKTLGFDRSEFINLKKTIS